MMGIKPLRDAQSERPSCSSAVGVQNLRLGAEIELEGVDLTDPSNTWTLMASNVRSTGVHTFSVPVALDGNQSWRARQKVDGTWSSWSAAVTPRDHTLDYPSGLPDVRLHPSPLRECGRTLALYHVPGATLHVVHDGNTTTVVGSAHGRSSVDTGDFFVAGKSVNARQSLCGANGAWWDNTAVVAPPFTSVPAPQLSPALLYEEQELMVLTGLRPGSRQQVDISGVTVTPGYWPTTAREVDLGAALGRGVMQGEVVDAIQEYDECDLSSVPLTSLPASSCSLLPYTTINQPRAGDEEVVASVPTIPGARIRVWDASAEIGDNGGDRVALTRPLVSGETIRVMTQLGGCRASGHYEYIVQ